MAREEEIIRASHLYATYQQKPFVDGAKWADKTMIEKACEWLEENLLNYWSQINANNTDDFIENFRKVMKE